MRKKMKQPVMVTVYPTREQMKELKALKERTRISVSIFIRDGIELLLEKERKSPTPSFRKSA